ncbi:LPXTG-motif cell wall anchor domain-containing protein [Dyadobacter soli]|uniref:LPXTG-motif cell wall anchor domain-containing protein n=1 Tax=Dyadobacter soli TaxID=659014 RepID=A0A1G6UQ65_9BACT|nr:tail fiber domain-containing protein [Dyadobacter soli]SDD42695.1 LPXTG-motif cell wall anchor domain-containing protein [Dyadobacter soli]
MITFFTSKFYFKKSSKLPLRRLGLKALIGSLLVPAGVYAQQTDTLLVAKDTIQNVRMAVFQNGGFVLGGEYTGDAMGIVPAAGPGTRLFWYPGKAAFRAGSVTGSQWAGQLVGDYSIAVGYNVRASASGATAFGNGTTAAQVSSFAVGESNVASGAASVAMGYHAHTNARQGSFVFSDRSSADTLRAGVNHSANWRLSGGFRIFTSSNLSTGLTVQSGSTVSNWGQSDAVISTSTGAMLTTGGVWQNASDVNRKHRFEQIANEEILEKLRKLPVTRWSYKTEAENIRHIGPMAQDFYAAFGLGSDNRGIGTVDADGVALAGIKALEERTRNLAGELESLKAENAALRQQMQDNNGNSWMGFAGFGLLALGGGLVWARRRMASGGSRVFQA